MDMKQWKAMKKSMVAGGWKEVVALNRHMPEDVMKSLESDYARKYGGDEWVRQWYWSPNAYKTLFVKPNPDYVVPDSVQPMRNQYRKPIIARLDKQTEKGLEKYNTFLHDNGELTMDERLEHLAEELTDGLQYIEHLKVGREQILGRLTTVVADMVIWVAGMPHPYKKMLIDSVKELNDVAKELSAIGKPQDEQGRKEGTR